MNLKPSDPIWMYPKNPKEEKRKNPMQKTPSSTCQRCQRWPMHFYQWITRPTWNLQWRGRIKAKKRLSACCTISYEEMLCGGNGKGGERTAGWCAESFFEVDASSKWFGYRVVFPRVWLCSERLVVVLNTAPVTDGEQPHHRLVVVLVGVEFETMSCLFIFPWTFTPPIAPPTIAPITVNTTRNFMAFPFFVCQKGWRLEVTAKFPGFLASMPLK